MLQETPSSPYTTLAILLGASEWPYYPEFQGSLAFANSANRLKTYLLNAQKFGLPSKNLLDLFNKDLSADDIDRAMSNFLHKRISTMNANGNPAKDLLVYYVGHGGFIGPESEYFLAIRRTREENPRSSSIAIMSLAHTLKEKARWMRRLVILDSCFSAIAFSAFQAAPGQVAQRQSIDAFREPGEGTGHLWPERGTALLCSSGPRAPSLIASTSTMFTEALLYALSTGNRRQQDKSYISLRELTALTNDFLADSSAPRSYLHSPDQSEGDVADIPFFPNLATRNTSINSVQPTTHTSTNSNSFSSTVKSETTSNIAPEQAKIPSTPGLSPATPTVPPYTTPWIPRRTMVIGTGIVAAAVLVGGGASAAYLLSGNHSITPPTPKVRTTSTVPEGWSGIYTGHSSIVLTVAWSPNGTQIASGSGDNTVQVWSSADGKLLFTYKGHTNRVHAVAWSSDGKRIASGSSDNTVQVWNAEGGSHITTYSGHTHGVNTIAWSSDGKRIASGSNDNTVQVWNAEDGSHITTYSSHNNAINAVTWSPDNIHIASGAYDKTVQVWNAINGSNLIIYRGHTDRVTAVPWSFDGSLIASGSYDKTIQVWNTTNKKLLLTYNGHTAPVLAVVWSPNVKRQQIVSASADHTVQVWSVSGGKIFTYKNHTDQVIAVAWSPDSKQVASGGADHTVRIWNVDQGSL